MKDSTTVFLICFLGFLAGISISMSDDPVLLAASIVLALIALAITVKSVEHPKVVLYVVIIISASVSLFREFMIPVGRTRTSLSGLIWVAILLFITLFSAVIRKKIHVPSYLLPFWVFSAWIVLRLLIGPSTIVGLKDLLWYSLPVFLGTFIPFLLRDLSEGNINRNRLRLLEDILLYSVFIPVALYILGFATGLVQMTWRGPVGELIGDSRGIPLFLLVPLSVALVNLRFRPVSKKYLFFSILILGVIFLSLARMASFLAVCMLAIITMNPRKKLQIIVTGFIVLILIFVAVTNIPALQHRFFFTEDWVITDGLKGFRTAGRDQLWTYTYTRTLEKPILGWGLGSSRIQLADLLSYKKDVAEFHPHNEYLQVFHDLGIVGLFLFLYSWLNLFRWFWNKWENAGSEQIAKWSLAAVLCIFAVLVASTTGNIIHFPNVIIPVMIIVVSAGELIIMQEGEGNRL